MTTTLPTSKARSEVSPDDCWNVEVLYPSYDAWEKALQKATPSSTPPSWPELTTFRGTLNEGADKLKRALEKNFEISRELEKLHTYAHLRHDEEITNDKHKSGYQRIMSLVFAFQEECAWLDPEILALPETTIETYLQDPSLQGYRFYIEKIVRMRPHTLSADKEELLAMSSKAMQAPPKAFSALNNADIQFGMIKDADGNDHPLTHGSYQLYLRSPDRTLRENAFKQMHNKYDALENTMAELLSGEIESHIFQARAHHYPSSLEAALFPKKIPQDVYRSLIAAVRKHLPTLHRYVAVRKKLLNLDELHLYDMYLPLVPDVDFSMDYSEAEDYVIRSVSPLGNEYQDVLKKGMKQERWVDRYENKNKRSGGYSSGCYDSNPYILMNFKGILRDTFTLAHEAGHSMHSYMSHTSQPYHYGHYPIFIAEVASTFNEELLMDLMLKETQEKEKRRFLINEKIEDIRATLFRQTMFAEFELKIHELAEAGTPLTPTLLKTLYTELNRDYFGPDIVIDEEAAIEWARIPHFYYNFYVFQYATGISAALTLAHNVLAGDHHARDNYLTFLKGGSSLFPIDLLKSAGVDLTTPAPVEAALQSFDTLVSELDSK